jgi:hypothetical protein
MVILEIDPPYLVILLFSLHPLPGFRPGPPLWLKMDACRTSHRCRGDMCE